MGALAGFLDLAQSGGDRERPIEAGCDVADRHAAFDRIILARDAHDAAFGLHDEVKAAAFGIGAIGAKGAD